MWHRHSPVNARTRTYVRTHAHTRAYTHSCTRAFTRALATTRTRTYACTHAHIQVRRGGLTELDMSGKEGLPVAVAAAGLLERSAATLTRLDVR
jgi:hypothetical protein